MVGEVREIDPQDLPRVLQLLGKTNQWNLTTRRHGAAQVQSLLARPRSIGLTLRLDDRFGSSGLIAVLLAVPDEADTGRLVLDSWLMSCRAIGRTAEQFLFSALVTRARALDYRVLVGELVVTAKNAPVVELYPSLGFEPADERTGTIRRFVLPLDAARVPWTALRAPGGAVA